MAIIQSIDEIRDLIPEPDYRPFGTFETVVPMDIVRKKMIFAVTVSSVTGKAINIFRLRFVLLRRAGSFYLTFTNFLNEKEHTDYISLSPANNELISKDDWKFEKDDIGLFARSECKDNNIIYIVDNPREMGKIREKLIEKRLSKEITVEVTVV